MQTILSLLVYIQYTWQNKNLQVHETETNNGEKLRSY